MSDLFASLVEPRLCALLPSISKGKVKARFCTTCGKQYAPPYACPLDRYRPAAQAANTAGGQADDLHR